MNLRRRLKKFGAFKLNRAQSTIYMEPLSEDIDLDEVLEHFAVCVRHIAALCRACVCRKGPWRTFPPRRCLIWKKFCWEQRRHFKVEAEAGR